jgi:hypothetical protein
MKKSVESYGSIYEIAEILALGLQRVLAKQSSGQSAPSGESSLHNSPIQSGDQTGSKAGENS